ncbi:hypothetical protein [Streptomyces sp. NPDC101455]|uniref:hypothetical protein n=1 Tax=Streptomyces sp. NPDC101455 TaxID=3366142 RepID=UPI0038145C06
MTINEPFQPLTPEQRDHLTARCGKFVAMKSNLDQVPYKQYVEVFGHLAIRVVGGLAQGVIDLGEGKHSVVTAFVDAKDERLTASIAVTDGSMINEDDMRLVGKVILTSRAAFHEAGIVARTTEADGGQTMRVWKLVDGHPLPLPGHEAARVYAINTATGEPQEPQHDVTYTDAFDIAPMLLRHP